jgi:hypothetical protein
MHSHLHVYVQTCRRIPAQTRESTQCSRARNAQTRTVDEFRNVLHAGHLPRCSHGPAPINFTEVDNGMPIAIHANCATGAKEKVDQRIQAKHIWIEKSGLWFLDEVKKEWDGEKDAESR